MSKDPTASFQKFGGFVHPTQCPLPDGASYWSGGMTLRDWFAGQALANMAGLNPNLPGDPASERFFPETHELVRRQATWAYLMADAMLAERSKQ